MAYRTNLVPVGKRSRTQPVTGDIFIYQLKGRPFGFGRVIRDDARSKNPETRLMLLYFFQTTSKTPEIIPELEPSNLCIRPVLTQKHGWELGLFRTIANRPVKEQDRLPLHCFQWIGESYYDEFYNPLPGRLEPCGQSGITGICIIDDLLSDAAGIARIPFDDKIIKKPRKGRTDKRS